MAKDLSEELWNLGLLWSSMEFWDTELLSCRLLTCPAPQGTGLYFSAWSWQTFSLLGVLPTAYPFEGEVNSNTYNLYCWGWRVVSGLHIKNSLQCNEPGIISPLKSESPGKIVSLLSLQDNVGRQAGHSVASADYDSSTNHDSNCSQIIPLLLLSATFFMSQT